MTRGMCLGTSYECINIPNCILVELNSSAYEFYDFDMDISRTVRTQRDMNIICMVIYSGAVVVALVSGFRLEEMILFYFSAHAIAMQINAL